MGPAMEEAECHRPRPVETDIVSGMKTITISSCRAERYDSDGCGKKGKYFERKPDGWLKKFLNCWR